MPSCPAARSTSAGRRRSTARCSLVAVLAAATSGPLSAAILAPALAISFWRCLLGAAATAPFAARSDGWRAVTVGRREWRLMGASGVLLAAHFGDVDHRRPAHHRRLVHRARRDPAGLGGAAGAARRCATTALAWVGMVVAFAGILLLTGVDLSGGGRALLGDVLALLGGMFAAAYMFVGERARQVVPATPYNAIVFGVSAVVLLLACLVGRQPLGGFSATTGC